jgi:PAS domain S-box-containing protein
MNHHSPSVLLIDDDASLLEMIKLMAERSRDMSIQTAESAKEALGILQQKTFDVIVVDYDMPDINGIEFLKILRKNGDFTPVILFTGVGGEYTAIEALNNGANFLLKKGEDPRSQFRDLVVLVKKAVEKNFDGPSLGITQRIISEMINFSSDPGFAIDRDGKVVAWNDSLEHLTGTPATVMIGRGDNMYSEPFFGTRRKMLVNLVFETDAEIKRQKYMLVNRIPKGLIIAVCRGVKKDGSDWTLWMKAMPVYDNHGGFIASVGTVRDVTATFGDIVISDSRLDEASQLAVEASREPQKPATGLFKKILGKSSSYYKEGMDLFLNEKKYPEAIEAFDKALEIDDKLAQVWNDRGTCFREMGDHTSALKSLLRAVELAPENPEFLYNLGETLEMIGILYMSNKYLDSAIQTFRMVVNQMPNNASSWNHLGICFKEMGKTEESKFYFDRARDITLWKRDTPIERKSDEYVKSKKE